MNTITLPSIEVESCDILISGHLKWNRYFGETMEMPPRGNPSTCSTVLIQGYQRDGSIYRLLVDPAIRHSREESYFDLNRRTGLTPDQITHCFSTHHHFDHWNGIKYYPHAVWCTTKDNLPLIQEAVKQAWKRGTEPGDGESAVIPAERFQIVEGEFLPGVQAVPLPGHTKALHGIAFCFHGRRILAASDSVMTRNHFRDRKTEFQPDPQLMAKAAETIDCIAAQFDIVIPGHDTPIIL
ncbi:MAG: MBL fold metallo-hydrolase [Lachnospiraceae bacterium]|nr:MBL fold metallo-hydrolase [Lachnospiraceae bacterium]